jgi:hypothetical protein
MVYGVQNFKVRILVYFWNLACHAGGRHARNPKLETQNPKPGGQRAD